MAERKAASPRPAPKPAATPTRTTNVAPTAPAEPPPTNIQQDRPVDMAPSRFLGSVPKDGVTFRSAGSGTPRPAAAPVKPPPAKR